MSNVRQFQVVQKSKSKLLIRIVPINKENTIAVEHLKQEITEWIGLPLEIEVEYMENINPTKTGKLRFTISNV